MRTDSRTGGTRNQVVIRVTSGLGNQLFQLAWGVYVASKRDADLLLDTTWFGLVAGFHRPKRIFRLNRLHGDYIEAFRGARRLAVGFFGALYDWKKVGLRPLEALGKMQVAQENSLTSRQPEGLFGDPNRRLYLNGYWQTAEAFMATRLTLTPLLQPKAGLSNPATWWLNRIKSEPAAFVHVRRGDYAHWMGEQGMLPESYYRRAAETLRSKGFFARRWFVFAEDAAWAKQNLGFLGTHEFVEYESVQRDIEDLHLMAACDAGIIANSSYSWWGAALGDRDGRPVVAPDHYWNRPGTGTQHWGLPAWERIPGWD